MDQQSFPSAGAAPFPSESQTSGVAPETTQPSAPAAPLFVPIAETRQETVSQESAAATPQRQDAESSAQSSQSQPEDYRQLYQQVEPRLQQLQQYERAFAELQQMAAQAEQQRREEEAQRTFQSRRDQIYATAGQMAPDDAITFIRRQEDMEVASLRGEINRIRQEAEQQKFQAVATVAGPLYAQKLAKDNNLPNEYAERLAMLPPQQMDHYLPVLVQEYQQRSEQDRRYQEVLNQLDQLRRTQQAQHIQSTGAHTVSNVTQTPAATQEYQVEAGSRDHLLGLDPRLAEMFGYRLNR